MGAAFRLTQCDDRQERRCGNHFERFFDPNEIGRLGLKREASLYWSCTATALGLRAVGNAP